MDNLTQEVTFGESATKILAHQIEKSICGSYLTPPKHPSVDPLTTSDISNPITVTSKVIVFSNFIFMSGPLWLQHFD